MAPSRWRKKGPCTRKTKQSKGTKIMAVADHAGLPVPIHVASATPHEVTLKQLSRRVWSWPTRALDRDKAHDRDSLDATAAQGTAMTVSHREGHKARKPRIVGGCSGTNAAGEGNHYRLD
jgi:hypothetical protein